MLVCPYTSEENCSCKKPKTGLVDICVEKYGLEIAHCWVVGDMGKNDIAPAKTAGRKGALVLTGGGKGSLGAFRHTWEGFEADCIADDALEAAKTITGI